MSFDAVILAGGAGSRLGGVSKADLVLGGERLLDVALRAASGARTTVVVGAVEAREGVVVTREDPPGTGPASGLLAGLDAVAEPSPWTLVLACDLPDAPAAAARLLDALAGAPTDADGLCLHDADGRQQHLAALYRTPALRAAFDRYGDPANRSVRGVMAGLALASVDPGDASVDDLDTPEQLARWRGLRGDATESEAEQVAWRAFVEDACARLGLDASAVDEHALLRLGRAVAHTGARPMAPVATHILGLAAAAHPGRPAADLLATLTDAASSAPRPSKD